MATSRQAPDEARAQGIGFRVIAILAVLTLVEYGVAITIGKGPLLVTLLSVAAIANITDYLYFVGWDGFNLAPEIWAAIMLVIASVLGLLMMLARRDAGFLLVLVWAFAGIAVKQTSAPTVVLAAWIAAAAMLGLAVFSLLRGRRVRRDQRILWHRSPR